MKLLIALIFSAVSAMAQLPFSCGDHAQIGTLDPRRLSGLAAYYRSSHLGGLSDGSLVSTWSDISGNALDAVQTTNALAPGKFTNLKGELVAHFESSSNQFMVLPAGLSLSSRSISAYVRTRGVGATDHTGPCWLDLGNGNQCSLWLGSFPPYKLLVSDPGFSRVDGTNTPPSTTEHVLSFIGQSSAFSIFNGTFSTSVGSALANNTLTGGIIGKGFSVATPLRGDVSEIILYNRPLSATEDAYIKRFLACDSLKRNIVFDGDSLTSGYTVAYPTATRPGVPYPEQCGAILRNVHGLNFGVAGAKLTQMPSFALSQYLDTNTYTLNAIVIWGGTNDISIDNTDGPTTISRLQTYVTNRRNEGWPKLVALTMLKRTAWLTDPTRLASCAAFNSSLRSDHSFVDGFADVAADSRLDDPTNTTYFQSDGIHLTAAGYGVVAQIVAASLTSL